MQASVRPSPFENEEFARLFAKLRRPVASKIGKKIIEVGSIRNNDSLLDLGCGPGLISKSIMMQRTLKRALLVDSSREMVAAAKRNLSPLDGEVEVRRVNLVQDNLDLVIGSKAPFDHVIAIDLWHLLEARRKLARFLLEKSLSSKGNLTISLHKETSEKSMLEWHGVRSEVREAIKSKLKEKYPDFEFQPRSKGATVHKDEVSVYLAELSKAGFKLSRRAEDSELADVNQMARHLPESLRIELRQNLPGMPEPLLKRVVNSSAREVLSQHKGFESSRIATEVFYVFEKRG